MRSCSQKAYIDHKISQGIDIVDPSLVLKVKLSPQDNDQMKKRKEEELGETLRYFLDKWKSNGETLLKTFLNDWEGSRDEESCRTE